MNTVQDERFVFKKRIHRKKRELKRDKLHPTVQKKFELNIIELKNNLEVLTDSRNELQTRLVTENKKLINLKQQVRDIRKHGETNPFNFHNTLKDDEIDLAKFFNITEKSITLYENEPIFNVITDAGKDEYNDGEPVEFNRFFKNLDQLPKSIEKVVDKYDETLEVPFSGEAIMYTLVFRKVKRFEYGTGCDDQQNIIENRTILYTTPKLTNVLRNT